MMVLLASITLSSFLFMANPTGEIDVASLKVWVLFYLERLFMRRHSELS